MESNYKNEQAYLKAKEQVKEIKGFYAHLTVFILVMPFIIYINLEFVPHYHWFWFSLFGWGIGLFSHWLGVIGIKKFGLGKDWEERKIKEFMENDRLNKR
jgi:hypothetical protein